MISLAFTQASENLKTEKQDMKIAILGTGMVGKQQLLEADPQVWQFIAVTHIP